MTLTEFCKSRGISSEKLSDWERMRFVNFRRTPRGRRLITTKAMLQIDDLLRKGTNPYLKGLK
jgi:hypothetical protein